MCKKGCSFVLTTNTEPIIFMNLSCVRIGACACVCVCARARVCLSLSLSLSLSLPPSLSFSLCTLYYIYTYTYIYTYIYIYIYTYIHIYTIYFKLEREADFRETVASSGSIARNASRIRHQQRTWAKPARHSEQSAFGHIHYTKKVQELLLRIL